MIQQVNHHAAHGRQQLALRKEQNSRSTTTTKNQLELFTI